MKKVEMVFLSLLCTIGIVASGVIAYVVLVPKPVQVPLCCIGQLEITGVTFQTGNATISLRNIGARALSISSVEVDDVAKTVLATGGDFTGSGPYDFEPGESGTITISLSWTSGNTYTFMVKTEWGKLTYRATAP